MCHIACRSTLTKQIVLDDFFNHVRRALFASPMQRHDAAAQLRALSPMTEAFADCHAFVLGVKQIFSRMYPTQATDEPEPMPLREAVVHLHKLLADVQKAPFARRPTDFQKAWAGSTIDLRGLYHHCLMDVTAARPHVYLKTVYDALENAREYYVQMTGITATAFADSDQVISAAAEYLGVSAAQLHALQAEGAADRIVYPDAAVEPPRARRAKRGRGSSPETDAALPDASLSASLDGYYSAACETCIPLPHSVHDAAT